MSDNKEIGKGRRAFLKKGTALFMGSVLGSSIVFAANMPEGMIPIGLLGSDDDTITGKHAGLTILNDRPINAENACPSLR